MKSPEKVIIDLSDKSLSEQQSLQDWLDYLYALREELNMRIRATESDVEKLTPQ